MTHSRIVFLLFFTGLGVPLTACKNTCEEALKKTISCAQGEGLKSSLREEHDLAIKVCKPHQDEVGECIKIGDCTEFHRCMKKAVAFREAAPVRQPATGAEPAMEEPAMAEPDMPVVPD